MKFSVNALKSATLFKLIAIFFIALFLWIWIQGSYFQTEAGYSYYYQNMLLGNIEIYTDPGIHFKIPYFSRVTPYKQVMTVTFGSSDDEENVTRSKRAILVRFADTYTGEIPATFRYKLPSDKTSFEKIHKDFRSFENLVDALLTKISRDVVVNTATQYTGEEFFQGGLNQFKAALIDQLRNGIYKTERKQVEIEQMDLAPVGLGQEESTQLRKAKTLVWKTVPLRDQEGQVLRLDNQMDEYGIEVTQITLGTPIPEEQLEQLLADKKRLVADRIKAVQEQETAKAQAKTAQLRADIERTKAKQEALKQKELAIITKQREVEEAQKQAEKEVIEYNKVKELASIEKAKELEVAQAEREIQKARFEAAEFEAKTIRETGIAKAEVLKAHYQARIPEIYLAEIKKDIAQIIYPNLKGIKIDMPHNIVNLGGTASALPTSLDVLASFATLSTMNALEAKAQPKRPKPVTQPATVNTQ
ncbi:MAG: SPFH domain-containing protein [Pseudomonadota bacterium]|nr:SPFH domain-containing protein [Pseudomonadota bacterium]